MKSSPFKSPQIIRYASTLLVCLMSIAAFSLFASEPPPMVVANGEELAGGWVGPSEQVAVFRGVPFARPPVGPLRWRSPQPNLPRDGRQAARVFAPACLQGPGMVDWYEGIAEAFGNGPEVVGRPNGMSEDCLYLNVWSSRPEIGADLPVMVFVHGGSNSGGWSYEPNYLGMNLAARGVVVVTIAYRVGPFGFFSHPALENGQGEPAANFALQDIRAAFQWIRSHIAVFGGDPGNITGFGESAGAFNLVDLLLADLAQGKGSESLFRRLVSQSIGGPAVVRRTLAEEQANGAFLVQQLGLGAEATAEQLRQIPSAEILEAARQFPDEHYFSAVIDGKTMPRHPLEILQNAQTSEVELIIGTNADEWHMYIDENVTRKDVEQWAAENAPGHQEALLAAVDDERDARRALDRLRTARQMLCPSRFLAGHINAAGGKAWVYYFNRQRTGEGGASLGVYHGAELPYVFDRHDPWLPTDPADLELTQTVVDYWVQFARAGDPNLSGKPRWETYTRQRPAVMELGEKVGSMGNFAAELCDVLSPGYRTLEMQKR